MKRSPGPTPCSPFTTRTATSESRKLALDPALHPLGERVARALNAGQVDDDELRCRRPRRSRCRGPPCRVVCGRSETIADLGADDGVGERRLAHVRAARPARRTPSGSPREPRHHRVLERPASRPRRSRGRSRRGGASPWTAASRRSAVCSGQMTTSPSSRGPATAVGAVHGERQHVGGLSLVAVIAVQLADPVRVDQLDAPGGRRSTPGRLERAGDGLAAGSAGTSPRSTVNRGPARRGARSRRRPRRCAARAGGARRPRRRTARSSMSSTSERISPTTTSPERWSRGRSIWVTSPVTTISRPEARAASGTSSSARGSCSAPRRG